MCAAMAGGGVSITVVIFVIFVIFFIVVIFIVVTLVIVITSQNIAIATSEIQKFGLSYTFT
jgi:hypothetical protein